MSWLQLVELDQDLDQDLDLDLDQESDQYKDQDQDLDLDKDQELDLDHICTSLKLFALIIICLSSNWLTKTQPKP